MKVYQVYVERFSEPIGITAMGFEAGGMIIFSNGNQEVLRVLSAKVVAIHTV